MEIKKKTITRSTWARIEESRRAFCRFNTESFSGVAYLMELTRVREPLIAEFKGETLKIVDDGYFWLQIAPENENFWITVMYDENGCCLQYYFDMTLKNIIDEEGSYFYDLFLDLVAMPDGRLIVLDEDELDCALSENVITKEEYIKAQLTLSMLKENIPAKKDKLNSFCYGLFDKLKKVLN